MTTICNYCGAPASSSYCSICGNTLPAGGHAHSTHQGGLVAERLTQGAEENVAGAILPAVKKFFGLSEFVNVLVSVHSPIKGIRSLVERGDVALSQAFVAYIEFVTIVPFVITQIIHPMGRAVGYPIMYQGAAIENTVLFYFVAAIFGALGLVAIRLLPNSLFAPRTKSIVIASSLYMAMYASAYITAADFLKVGIWVIAKDLTLPTILGTAVLAAVFGLQYYILRRVLSLSWLSVIILMAIGLAIGLAQGFILAALGLANIS